MTQRAELIAELKTIVLQARAEGHRIAPITPRGMTDAQLAAKLDEIQRLFRAKVAAVPTSAMIAEMQAEV